MNTLKIAVLLEQILKLIKLEKAGKSKGSVLDNIENRVNTILKELKNE